MTIKRIFSDMDGTLLNSEGRVSSENSKAIRDAQIPLTLVSARATIEMREAIEALQRFQTAFHPLRRHGSHVCRRQPSSVSGCVSA